MMGKRKKTQGRNTQHSTPPLGTPKQTLRLVWRKARLLLASAVPLATAYVAYTSTGADDLRSKVYEPLFKEVGSVEMSLMGGSLEPFNSSAMSSLSGSGELERLPGRLRQRIIITYRQIGSVQADLGTITEVTERAVSQRIMGIRTQDQDRVWLDATSRKLRSESEAKPGIASIAQFQFSHTARGRAIDARDPNHPVIAGPGGPSWNLNDWATYPSSVAEMERIWTDEDFLYLDPFRDDWYYRITRSDLERNGMSLGDFLRPIYELLAATPEYKHFITNRDLAVASAKALTNELSQRIRQPKHLSDLIP